MPRSLNLEEKNTWVQVRREIARQMTALHKQGLTPKSVIVGELEERLMRRVREATAREIVPADLASWNPDDPVTGGTAFGLRIRCEHAVGIRVTDA